MSDYPRLFQCAQCGSRGALFAGFQECMVCGAPVDDETIFDDGEEDVFDVDGGCGNMEDIYDEY